MVAEASSRLFSLRPTAHAMKSWLGNHFNYVRRERPRRVLLDQVPLQIRQILSLEVADGAFKSWWWQNCGISMH